MLFEQYAGKMMTICLRYAGNSTKAEDVLQEAFIRVFLHIKQFAFKGSLEGWVRRIVVNAALKSVQLKKISFSEISGELLELPEPGADILSNLSHSELLSMVSQLPDGYRIVFNLYVMEGFSHEEIAGLLHIKAVTSRTQLLKARRMLREQICQYQKIPF
jgi:RNA polymerase sigma factor (sigma-70 family)